MVGYDPHEIVSVLHDTANEDAGDARREMLAAIGDLGGWQPWDQWVCGATYVRGGTSKGGIIIPDSKGGMTHNDQLLGKTFMLLAAGPSAFPRDLLDLYGGEAPQPGSWFLARPASGIEVSLRFAGASADNRRKQAGWPCRLFLAKDLMGPIPHPGWIV